jgi:hypothetical protein
MKKLIASIAVCCALGFAVALADSNDPSMDSVGDTNTNTNQAAGTADTSSDKTSTTTTTTTESHKSSQNDKWTNAKSCTDASGVVHQRGKSGFQACVDQMRKNEHDQMGGTLPSDQGQGQGQGMSGDTTQNPSQGSSSDTSH